MSHQKINAALATALQAVGVETAFENAEFDPPESLYYEESYLPADTREVGLETTSTDVFVGIYQITVNAPKDAYKREAMEAAQVLAQAFKRGTVLVFDGVSVRCRRVQQAAGYYSGNRYLVPVSVEWQALIK